MAEKFNALCGQNAGQCAGDDENARLTYRQTGPRSVDIAMECAHCERADTHTAHAGGAEVWPGAMCEGCFEAVGVFIQKGGAVVARCYGCGCDIEIKESVKNV